MQDSELQIQMEVEDNELNIQMDATDPEQPINLSTEDTTVIVGNVDDVVVNGVSVVVHKIANINIKSINNESVSGTGNINIPIITKVSQLTNDKGYVDKSVNNLIYYYTKSYIDQNKQNTLISGQNIKTINNKSILSDGNLDLATSSSLENYLPKNYVVNSRSTSSGYTYDVRYVNNLIKTSNTSSDNVTYSCNYIDNTFLTLATLPRWDGGNQ